MSLPEVSTRLLLGSTKVLPNLTLCVFVPIFSYQFLYRETLEPYVSVSFPRIPYLLEALTLYQELFWDVFGVFVCVLGGVRGCFGCVLGYNEAIQ